MGWIIPIMHTIIFVNKFLNNHHSRIITQLKQSQMLPAPISMTMPFYQYPTSILNNIPASRSTNVQQKHQSERVSIESLDKINFNQPNTSNTAPEPRKSGSFKNEKLSESVDEIFITSKIIKNDNVINPIT